MSALVGRERSAPRTHRSSRKQAGGGGKEPRTARAFPAELRAVTRPERPGARASPAHAERLERFARALFGGRLVRAAWRASLLRGFPRSSRDAGDAPPAEAESRKDTRQPRLFRSSAPPALQDAPLTSSRPEDRTSERHRRATPLKGSHAG
ncbi:hypothetical protein AOLI_G00073090 [Acnodon oligacanthus]